MIYRSPEGCVPSNCTTFIGIDRNQGNPDYLDIHMEGSTEGWIAVGFTENPSMVTCEGENSWSSRVIFFFFLTQFSADVLACNYNPSTSMVEALDTWNAATPARGNTVDDDQDVFLFSGELRNGRISCT